MFTWTILMLQVSSLACAVVGGVFLAFSDFMMRSLNKTAAGAGINAMQVINREIIRSVFVSLLLILAAASPLLAGYALISLEGLARTLTTLGGAIYLLGTFGVTVIFNIPKNNRLDRNAPDSPESRAYWDNVYMPRWTAWNHVRTVACLVSAGCYSAASLALAHASHSL